MSRPLKVGVQLPEVEYVVRWPQLLEMARLAEEIGFDSLWVGDHLQYVRPLDVVGPWEAWSTLAALAAVTSKVELGPLVACTSFHSPAMLAKKAATVDEISDGRLILGLGAGWNEADYTTYGFPYNRRVSRFEEAFTIIRTLLREGQIDFEGQFYSARDCELLPRGAVETHPNGPPLMLGTTRPRMLSIAVPHIDMWNEWHDRVLNTPEGAAEMSAKVTEAAQAAGRDPSEIARTVTVLVQLPGGTGRAAGGEIAKPTPPLKGTPEELARAIAAYADVGISHVQLVLDPITHESIEEAGRMLEFLDRS
jgi:alkanesulfonate monooxygenase SsuD/methylene tetrahydromethanopterin reductase-like flavin-dependent oxidoreductase (luciferase family)